jgi:hypothetical protein
MTQLAQHPAYLQIEDRLDVVGQKYRVQRMVRGGLLFLTTLLGASWVAAGAVTLFSRDGQIAPGLVYVIGGVWLLTVLAGLVMWVVRPLMLRPKPIEVARLVESRMEGLHNGLTNAILLAERDDVAGNPWSGTIVDEIAAATGSKPIGDVVRWSDLKSLSMRCGLILLPMVVTFLLFPNAFGHGLKQMMKPAAFIPQQGAAEIVSVEPGNATRVAGQPLEILVTAKAPQDAIAKVIFYSKLGASAMQPLHAGPERSAAPGSAEADLARFAYRLDHLDETVRYRVEVAGTQSDWFTLTVVRQIKLTDLSLTIRPPAYTNQPPTTLNLKTDNPNDPPINITQGSEVIFNATADVPIDGAMLQTGVPNSQPIALRRVASSQRFTGTLTMLDDTTLSMLVTDSSGTVAATLPASPIAIACVKDAGPKVEMKWPTSDTVVAPDAELKLSAVLRDDYGLASARVMMAQGPDTPLAPVETKNYPAGGTQHDLSSTLKVDPAFRKHGQSIRVQVDATDNRDLTAYAKDMGPQTTSSTVIEIKFRDKELSAAERKEQIDKLRQILQAMLKNQQDLHARTIPMKDAAVAKQVQQGQTELRDDMTKTADTFAFDDSNEIVKRTLQVLALNPAKDAVDLSAAYQTEPAAKEQAKLSKEIQSRQRRIIQTLESLLAMLNNSPEPTTQPAEKRAGDLEAKKEAYKQLAEDLKKYMEEQRKILDQTANLAKKPVDDWTDKDKKLAEELAMSQEKLDAFMQEKVADFSKLAEQDMSNASLLKELMELYSEVTMAKDALKKQAMEIAVPIEEMGLEMAKSIESNLEKWLMDEPDRQKWSQEDPITKADTPMAELPKELEDMVGELMEEQEDLFEEMEDANANWTDSMDKGAGWDAADGPIANMSAKGVTGNQLPNNNEMGGRSGEGRSGKSQGEFVEETATGKGGRNTPTRLDPTAFQQGQIKDESKDPVGGATGGGKVSGQGGQGLEGPVPPKVQEEMKRLASKQAELRNKAERLNLQYQLGRYDNFNLLRATALMRRVESDINANRYNNALRRKDVLIDSMDTSQLLLGGQVHVQQDSSPTVSQKTQQDIHDAMKGDLPPAWQDALKQYYEKLGQQ